MSEIGELPSNPPSRAEGTGDGFLDEEEPVQVRRSLPFGSKVPLLISDSRFSSEFSDVDPNGDNDAERNHREAVREVQAVARREMFFLRLWKAMFIILALITAGLVSAGTYIFMKAEEDDDYHESYDLFVSAMRDAVDVHVSNIHVGFETMANIISSDAAIRGDQFPYYTMRDFEATGEGIRKFSKVEIFTWIPYVRSQQVLPWLNYSLTNQGWLETSRQYALRTGEFSVVNTDYATGSISPFIYDFGGQGGAPQLSQGGSPYGVVWQTSPPVFDPKTINFDFNFFSFANSGVDVLEEIRQGYFCRILIPGETGALASLIFKPEDHEKFHARFVDWNKTAHNAFKNPHGAFLQPVFVDALDPASEIVGYVAAALGWDAYVTNLLPEGVSGIHCILKNTCGQAISYRLMGNRAYFQGWGDFHDPAYDSTERVIPFHRPIPDNYVAPEGQCIFSFHIYASSEFEESYRSSLAVVLTSVVAGAFFFLIATYFMYDWFVGRRNNKVTAMAAKSNEIVSSLFPKNVRDRLYDKDGGGGGGGGDEVASALLMSGHGDDDEDLDEELLDGDQIEVRSTASKSVARTLDLMDEDGFMYKSRPIADLYPETTIMFADIAGFTAWSSVREPTQVFVLLETLYKAFDVVAKRRRVFKVETIGDCYVAVAGLPEPMPDHAVVMCRFAKDCRNKMRELTRRLEAVLGPDTMELDIRFGLHSGSVTAGVLRGEKSRFQLFGDSMNTASRMESTGKPGMIHVSLDTANFLKAAGKGHWVKPREDKVNAKGKGLMQTFWVTSSNRDGGSDSDPEGSICDVGLGGSTGNLSESELDTRNASLVRYNYEVFAGMLSQIAEQRNFSEAARIDRESEHAIQYGHPLDEFKDTIVFPAPKAGEGVARPVASEALEQLEQFISAVATTYHEHSYHDFGHASHVTLSVVKLLSQIKTEADGSELEVNPSLLLALDPLAQLACVFAALVQDIEHTGVPNFVLAHEGASDSESRCIAEQHSINSAWELLMDRKYSDLREAIYHTEEEKQHFRQVFVQCVLATDLFDKKLSEDRNARWEKAFGVVSVSDPIKTRLDRQVTLLLETIIQASDMIHTMQHWDIYCKWNTLLFEEVYRAHMAGRITKNPAEAWYNGELSFFDKVVFPMTMRLAQSEAFRDGTIEAYMDFAKMNRAQWEENGRTMVAEMVVKFGSTDPETV